MPSCTVIDADDYSGYRTLICAGASQPKQTKIRSRAAATSVSRNIVTSTAVTSGEDASASVSHQSDQNTPAAVDIQSRPQLFLLRPSYLLTSPQQVCHTYLIQKHQLQRVSHPYHKSFLPRPSHLERVR
jgi:hypothetical protein